MAGHSKWANIKHKKGAADAKRGVLFTKLAKNITVAAKDGGTDPEFNFKLRTAIDLAKASNVPKDNIERAVKKGSGESGDAVIEEVLYEGYAAGGQAAILVEALTDNRNRTGPAMRHIFSKHGGNMAGSVKWMFEQKGIVRSESKELPSDDVQMLLIDAGAEDIAVDGDGLGITCSVDALKTVQELVVAQEIEVVYAGIDWIAKDVLPAPVNREEVEMLLESFDDDEDVSAVYTNINLG